LHRSWLEELRLRQQVVLEQVVLELPLVEQSLEQLFHHCSHNQRLALELNCSRNQWWLHSNRCSLQRGVLFWPDDELSGPKGIHNHNRCPHMDRHSKQQLRRCIHSQLRLGLHRIRNRHPWNHIHNLHHGWPS
jgi:hypothetical protein